MRCPQCGRDAPPGAYCGYCGARLPHAEGEALPATHRSRMRAHAYAADSRESLYTPAIISTLFPHLPPHRAIIARWLLIAGIALVVLIAFGRVIPLAVVLSAVLLPVLYLAYFYDTRVYEDEPLTVLAGTFLVGVLLGAALSLAAYRLLVTQRTLGLHSGPTPGYVALNAVLLPLVSLALMLVGPVVLYALRPRFNDILDGLVFGVASGLGFAAAQSIVYSWLIIVGPLQRSGSALDWVLPALRVALLTPLLDAASVGLICAALWLPRDPHIRQRPRTLVTSLPFAIAVAALGQVLPSLLTDLLPGQALSFIWYLLAAAILLMLARVSLHLGLLEKGAEASDAGERMDMIVCSTCQRLTPNLAFCSQCGVALRARPKRATTPARRTRPGGATEGGQS
ncbi:MAG: PrsW family glutamic-type intramembrane protease [Ktedonobacterales bacterium]